MNTRQYSRGRIDIIASIIMICTEEKRKTPIMYRANLSYDQVGRYVRELQEKELIEEVTIDGNAFYRTTAKGRDFLKAYEKIEQILHASGQPMYERYYIA